ncbi:hypothetical protein AS850_03565 [Frondihabitans sp. 762G35]|uniref:hypothetical protein n=1 Tax=Frondihabitans sp. 762G35 TaxID=1446794 RepID=UPI000D21B121|nr:hypothetical protein [Frondihabitans sp. 762G35]ARC56153.1 hypothetical protein AS850_03565 [Frondihabitans sp. 762G35]
MMDQRPVDDQQPRWVRRDSQQACFLVGALFLVLAILLPVLFIAGREWTAPSIVLAAVLEISWIGLAQAYLRSGIYKRNGTRR